MLSYFLENGKINRTQNFICNCAIINLQLELHQAPGDKVLVQKEVGADAWETMKLTDPAINTRCQE